ncbi:MAG: extensin family protein [Rhodobacteraceae bacterium]|nr:extensin family protein [Paracoccaceae bacterium]
MKLSLLALIFLAACGRSGAPDISAYPNEEGLTRLCNNPAILGTPISDISQGGCGIDNPVAVRYVAGVRLSTPATLNCRTASTLADWVENDAQDAVKKLRSRITEMTVFASYACRTRNNQRGARMSEHSLGNAIDIGVITLANGVELSVEDDWRKSNKEGAAIRALHESACGPFGTVLGPNSDRFHYNHFHFDTAAYRSGSYCR